MRSGQSKRFYDLAGQIPTDTQTHINPNSQPYVTQWVSDGQKSSARPLRHGQKLEADARAHKLGMRLFRPDFRRLIDGILVEKLRGR